MKVGIITIPPTINYGGILQAYALQTILEQMGHSVEIICDRNRYFTLPEWKKPLVYSKRIFQKYIGWKPNLIVKMEEFRRDEACKYTEQFIKSHLHMREYPTFDDIKKDDFDVFVVGSDQIWREKYNHNIERCFLDFAERWDVLRIAYAASFGTDKWEYNELQTENCKRLIKKFKAVSVRENSSVDLVRKHLNITAIHVLDPTMLLKKEDYIELIHNAHIKQSEGDLLCYILDNSELIKEFIADIASTKHLTPFYVYSQYINITAKANEWIHAPVEKWLRGFYDAKLVITDSFHAMVFSIIFGKPFILLGNEERGNARFSSLLNTAKFDCSHGIYNKLFCPDERTASAISFIKKYSMDFLKKNLYSA